MYAASILFQGEDFKIYVLRCCSEQFVQLGDRREPLIRNAVAQLKGTSYERMAPLEKAPLKTDCLTSIHYIFKQALGIDIPLTFVGDMPRKLLSLGNWKFHEIDDNEARCGDLVFAKRIREQKLLAHASLVLGANEIFHCRRDLGAVTETWEDFRLIFEQKLTNNQVYYIDPRNKELRKINKGIFMELIVSSLQ